MEIKGNHTKTEAAMKKCKHTPKPTDFQECLKWRIEMSRKGYVQHQCKACGSWAIWKKGKLPTVNNNA